MRRVIAALMACMMPLLASCVSRPVAVVPPSKLPVFIGGLLLERAQAQVVEATVLPLKVTTIYKTCANPSSFAASPDGSEVDVTCPSQDRVMSISIQADSQIVPPIRVSRDPTAIAYAPLGNYFYVVNSNSGSITPVDVATHRPGPPIKVGPDPTSIAVSPNSAYAYVSVSGANYIAVVSLLYDRVVRDINVAPGPGAIAVSATNALAYVAYPTTGTVTPIDLERNVALPPIAVGPDPVDVAFSSNGQTAFVVNQSAGTLTPVNVLTSTPNTPIPVGTGPVSVVASRGSSGGAVVSVPADSALTAILHYNPSTPGGPGTSPGKFKTEGKSVVEETLPDGTVLGIISLAPGSDPVAAALL